MTQKEGGGPAIAELRAELERLQEANKHLTAQDDRWQAAFTQCAGSLGAQPEVESADAVGVLMGRLLLLDVLFKNTNRRTCAT